MSLGRTALLLTLGIAAVGFVAMQIFEHPVAASEDGNILKNPGFEDAKNGLPVSWSLENKVKPKGNASLSTENVHSGKSSLKLEPNAKNKPWDMGHDPFGMGQGFMAGSLRGKKLYVSAWLAAEGEAAAAVVAIALGGRVPAMMELKQTSAKSGLVYREDSLLVPKDAKFVVVACVAQGTSGAAYIDDLFAGTEPPPSAAAPPAEKPRGDLAATISVDAASVGRRIPRTLYGMNIEWIWNGNGLWNPQTRSADADLVALTRDLGVTLLRFPGGIFSDFYHWKDGVGPQDQRKKTRHLPGDSSSSVNTFGTDEALAFADQVGARLLITVNAGTGTAQEAADWVRYVNGKGRRVEYWEVGNEIYVKMGHPGFEKSTMKPEEYGRKFLEFAKAMREADPGIKVGGIGDENYGALSPRAYGDWTSKVLEIAGGQMDFLSVHNGYAPVLVQDKGQSLRRIYAAMLAAPELVSQSLATAAGKLATLGGDRASHIRLAVTEWGPYFQMTPDGRFVDHVKTLGSALYVAGAMRAFLDSPQTDIATGFKLNDELYQGWIGKRGGKWVPKAPYYALQMYTKHFGDVLVKSQTKVDTFDTQPAGLVDALSAVPYLDVVASLSADRRTLFLLAINKSFDAAARADISLANWHPAGQGTAWTLNGTGIDANTGTQLFQAPGVKWARQASDESNPRFDAGGPNEVGVTRSDVTNAAARFTYSFPAHSVTVLELPVK